jgi:hypothetical protein
MLLLGVGLRELLLALAEATVALLLGLVLAPGEIGMLARIV